MEKHLKLDTITSNIAIVCFAATQNFSLKDEFSKKVEDFDAAEDGEAGEETHGAANEAQLGHQGNLGE